MKYVDPPSDMRDLGYERQRLTQAQNQRRAYDPAGMSALGQLSFEMGDLFHAGRAWLLSDASGDQVESVVDYFAQRCGSSARSILSQLPVYALKADFSEYDATVRARLDRLSITAEDIQRRLAPPVESETNTGLIGVVLIVVVLLAALGSCILGAVTAVAWVVRFVLAQVG